MDHYQPIGVARIGGKTRPLKPMIILALVSALIYPLLEIFGTLMDSRTGRNTTTNGAGWVYFHTFSEPAVYIFLFGLTAAVALSFIHLAVLTWRRSNSKVRTALMFLAGTIVTLFAFIMFLVGLMVIGGLIHQTF